jgi:hypothetical protein
MPEPRIVLSGLVAGPKGVPGLNADGTTAEEAMTEVDADSGSTYRQQADARQAASVATTVAARTYPRGADQVSLGIPTDGTSDCAAALNAIPANTGRVHLRGTFKVSVPITVKHNVQLVGTDRDGTTIEAGAGFVGAHVVKLGEATVSFNSRLQDITVDANGLANVAITAENIQEMSGLERVLVVGWTVGGIDFSGAQNQNYTVRSVELYGHTSGTRLYGMRTGTGWARLIQDLTAICAGAINTAAPANSAGLLLQGPARVDVAHFEGCVRGIDLNGATGSVIIGARAVGGTGIVTDLVHVRNVAQDNINLQGLVPNGATKSLNDLLHSYSYAGLLAQYVWGGGGVGADNLLNIGDPAAKPVFRAGISLGSGADLTSPTGNLIRASNNFDANGQMTARVGTADQVYVGGNAGIPLVAFGSAYDTVLQRSSAGVLGMPSTQAFETGEAATGSRPSAASVSAGAQFYDTTLGKPIWSNGTVWKDAAGTTV